MPFDPKKPQQSHFYISDLIFWYAQTRGHVWTNKNEVGTLYHLLPPPSPIPSMTWQLLLKQSTSDISHTQQLAKVPQFTEFVFWTECLAPFPNGRLGLSNICLLVVGKSLSVLSDFTFGTNVEIEQISFNIHNSQNCENQLNYIEIHINIMRGYF